MAVLTLRASGPRPPRDVWERYADPQRWPGWAPQVRRVEAIGRLRPGLVGQLHAYVPPPLGFRVLEVDARARTWTWAVGVGPVRVVLEHGVTEPADGGSGTWLRMRGPLPVLVAYAPVARLALHRLVH